MRVTFLSHFAGRGGSTAWLAQLLQLFQGAGHETTVLVSQPSHEPLLENCLLFQPATAAGWRERLSQYRALVESTRPDAVYFVSGFEEADLLRFLPFVRVRHIFTFERHDFLDSPFWVRQLVPYWEVATANTPDVFPLVRRSTAQSYAEVFTPYWIGPAFYQEIEIPVRPPAGRPLEICCIGRLERYQKRVDWLPEIVDGCQRAGRDFHWHLYGAGPAENWLRQELDRRHLHDRIFFHGWLTPEELAHEAPTHDLYFSCSRFEGFPVALQQAMFCGLACVAPDLPAGIHYVIEQGAVSGYSATSPQSAVQALLSATADLAALPQRKRDTRTRAFALFGPDVVHRQFGELMSVIAKARFNGRVADLRTAPKTRTLPFWKQLRKRFIARRALAPEPPG